MPTALLTEYSAAKAFVQRFSEGLAYEYRPMGIDIQVHTPYFIVSKLSKYRSASLLIPSSNEYAAHICKRTGFETVVNPHWGRQALLRFSCVLLTIPAKPRTRADGICADANSMGGLFYLQAATIRSRQSVEEKSQRRC